MTALIRLMNSTEESGVLPDDNRERKKGLVGRKERPERRVKKER